MIAKLVNYLLRAENQKLRHELAASEMRIEITRDEEFRCALRAARRALLQAGTALVCQKSENFKLTPAAADESIERVQAAIDAIDDFDFNHRSAP